MPDPALAMTCAIPTTRPLSGLGASTVSNVRYAQTPETISREVDGEVLLVPVMDQIVDLDDCFHLLQDPVANRVWELLAVARTLEDLVREITTEFEVAPDLARSDLEAFLSELVRIGAAKRIEA